MKSIWKPFAQEKTLQLSNVGVLSCWNWPLMIIDYTELLKINWNEDLGSGTVHELYGWTMSWTSAVPRHQVALVSWTHPSPATCASSSPWDGVEWSWQVIGDYIIRRAIRQHCWQISLLLPNYFFQQWFDWWGSHGWAPRSPGFKEWCQNIRVGTGGFEGHHTDTLRVLPNQQSAIIGDSPPDLFTCFPFFGQPIQGNRGYLAMVCTGHDYHYFTMDPNGLQKCSKYHVLQCMHASCSATLVGEMPDACSTAAEIFTPDQHWSI